jgi:hypothetical protein
MTQRNKTGKRFGPPPERGPQPQGMNGGRLVEPKLKKRKRYDINPFLKIKRSEYSKTIKTDKGYTNVPSMYGGQEYNEDFLTEMYKDNKIDPETGRRVKTYKTPEEATVAAKRRSSRLKTGGFNPEGSGYDYKRAKELDYKRDDKGHLPTRDYKTGMILKGKKHETFSKGVQEDFKKGYQLKKKGDRYYTIKSKREFNKLREKASLPHVSQSLKTGGPSQGERFVKFFGRQFNQNKDFVIKEAMTGLLKKDFQQRFKNIMNQAQKDFYAEEGITPYKMNFVAYNPKKEETGITSKETMGLKKGGFGCPHRENGVKSDIKGISN